MLLSLAENSPNQSNQTISNDPSRIYQETVGGHLTL